MKQLILFLQKHSFNLKILVENMSNLSIYVTVMHMQYVYTKYYTCILRETDYTFCFKVIPLALLRCQNITKYCNFLVSKAK